MSTQRENKRVKDRRTDRQRQKQTNKQAYAEVPDGQRLRWVHLEQLSEGVHAFLSAY